jgi:predicted GIY-YIG superfamily endonuclease
MQHALYRLFGHDGRLLYVGCTMQVFSARLDQHLHEKMWAPEIASWTVETFPDRLSALLAERTAIQSEAPLHNVRDSGVGRRVRRPAASLWDPAAA